MQDASSARDAEFVENVNGLLQDPEHELVWNTSSSQPEASTSTAATASAGGSGAVPQATPEQLAQLQALIAAVPGSGVPAPSALPGLTRLCPVF